MAIQRDYNPELEKGNNISWADTQQSKLVKLASQERELQRQVDYLRDAIQNTTDRDAVELLGKQLSEVTAELAKTSAIHTHQVDSLIASSNEAIVQAAEAQSQHQQEMERKSHEYNALLTSFTQDKERVRELKKIKDRTNDEQAELDNLLTKIESERDEISNMKAEHSRYKAEGKEGIGAIEQNGQSLKGIFGNGTAGTAWNAAISPEHNSATGKMLTKEFSGNGKIGSIANIVGKILDVTTSIRSSVNQWVDEAAQVLSANVGKINAAIEGTGQTYESNISAAVESLGLSRFVKQTDYINQIAILTAKGVTYNVEQRALLETIKDKTVASFNSTRDSLLRLIKLQQKDLTAAEFGLEAVLKSTLNSVFKDSTYLYGLYDTISGAITDASVVSGEKDVIAYNSVIQTWMGALYEAGVNSDTVSKIANGLNYLGSGNVSALASDESLQRLILLSMDSINMDYADVLQQGLSTSDINDLMTAIVKYLATIEKNTSDNNVLTSSYTNLFNMSMSDLKAFTNLANTSLSSLQVVNTSTALAATNQELTSVQSTSRTIAAEQITNLLNNAKFTFGNEIAKDADSYLTWKISNAMLDIFGSVIDAVGTKSKIGKVAQIGAIASEAFIFGTELKGVLGILSALSGAFGNENLQTFINGTPSYGGNTNSTSATITTTNGFKTTNNIETLKTSSAYTTATGSEYYGAADWTSTEDVEDETLNALKQIVSALVQSEADASHMAFATYLVGMENTALASLASIFADEDSMEETFTGENEVLKENLFKYADVITSNSTTTANTESA